METSRFTTDDLARVLVPSSPCLHGECVVYVLKRSDAEGRRYKTSLWSVPLGGGGPTRLTTGDHADREPVASGEALFFVSDRERGDQVWVLPPHGEARRLTSFGHGSLSGLAASPDGRHLLVHFTASPEPGAAPPLATERLDRPGGDPGPAAFEGARDGEPEWKKPDSTPVARVYARPHSRTDGAGWENGFLPHIWIIDATSGAARRLTQGQTAWAGACFSPDGRSVYAARVRLPAGDRDPMRNELVRIDVAGGAESVVPTPDGLIQTPSLSPDGARVAFVWSSPTDLWGWSNARLGVTDLATGATRLLATDLDRPVGDWCLDDLSGSAFLPWPPQWCDGALVVPAGDRASTRLLRVGLDGAHAWLTPWGEGVGSPLSLGEGRFAVLHGAPARFVEVARLDTEGHLVRLSDHNAALGAKARQPENVELVVDGVTVQGWYLAPRAAEKPGPGLLYIHGGPHAAYAPRFFFEMQWLADEGFAVLWTNPRGSHTFGEQYARCIDPHWGTPDGRDQLAFADWLAARTEVDGARLGVTGGSYGGFMTCFLAATSDRFRAAAADRGLYDWALDAAAGDFGHAIPETFGFDLPWRDHEPWQPYSLLRIAHQIRCPFLVLHGEGDLRCDKSQALALYEVLLRAGTPTALLLYPEEDHGMTRGGRLDRRADRLRQLSAWFKRFLA